MAAPREKVFKILILIVCLSGVCILNVKGALIVTTPSAIDGVLTSCGETRLTCSHENVAEQNTQWRITAKNLSIVCQETIVHANPNSMFSCGEFSFDDVTGLTNNDFLNSTAVVNPLPLYLSGSEMECIAGPLTTSPSVGNITLCVIGQLSRPMNVGAVFLPNNLTSIVLEWDTFSQLTCSRDTVSYTIAVDGVAVPPDNITALSNTNYIVSGLEANRMYTASVRTVISNCMSEESRFTFQIITETPTPIVNTWFYCANSSDSITLALSLSFPSSAPPGVVYPPTSELSVTVSLSNSSGLVSNSTFALSQSDAFYNLGNNESYTISVEAIHDTTGPSIPRNISLTTFIFDVDNSTTSLDDSVTVRLSDKCVENPTTFTSTLSYGSCPDFVTIQESQTFSSSGAAVFVLNLSRVTGELCIRVVVVHSSQPNRPLNTIERQLTFNSCLTASISSLAGSRVSIRFSPPESSRTGMVAHGTVATFGSTSSAYMLVGPSQSTCRNGVWTDLVERRTELAGWVIAVVLVIILFVAACVGGSITGYLVWHFCCSHKEKSKDTIELNEKEKFDEADGNHELSPVGDEYAVVDKSSKRKPAAAAAENQVLYQDPNSIQHETAPTGDVYAVTEKKQKKKGPTEAELAQMYSVPDKTKGGGLNYASLDMPAGGEAKRPAPTEYATVVN